MSNKHKMKLMEQFKVRQQEKKENGELEETVVSNDNVSEISNVNIEEVVDTYEMSTDIEEVITKVEEIADSYEMSNDVEDEIVELEEVVKQENIVEATEEILEQETILEETIQTEANTEIEEVIEEIVEPAVIEETVINEVVETVEEPTNTCTLFEFACCGSDEFFNNQIEKVAIMAEQEVWSSKENGEKDILKNYIFDTFDRCYELDIIELSDDEMWCCFNTGLMTMSGQSIFGLFTENVRDDEQDWLFMGFKTESDKAILDHFTRFPVVATYTDNNSDYYFNTNQDITLNVENILEENFESYPEEAKKLGKEILKSLMMNAFETTKKKVKRNARLAVPHFSNNKLGYLMPITIPVADNKYLTMALEVEKMALGNYSANTVSTKESAYSKARVVMKPESNWLI